jgi:hypothetical protein
LNKRKWICSWSICVLAAALLPPRASFAQECRDDLTAADQMWVHDIMLDIRYFQPPDIALKKNTIYTPDARAASQGPIIERLSNDETNNAARLFSDFGYVFIRFVHSCVRVVDPAVCQRDMQKDRCVDVTFISHEIRLVRADQAGPILPVPRSPVSTFFSGVPRPLLILNPAPKIDHDNRTGTTPGIRLKTDFLDMGKILRHQDSDGHTLEATATADLSRSIEHNFYHAAETFDLKKTRPVSAVQSFALHVEQENAKEPLGSGSDTTSKETIGLRTDLHFKNAYLRNGYVWAGGTASRHSVPQDAATLDTSEAAGSVAALVDGVIALTTLRAGVWFSGGSPNNQNNYQQLKFFSALYHDFLVKPNQAFGLQLLGGYGHTWGTPAQYAAFFAGNNNSNFLYDSPDALLSAGGPAPVIRSFGKQEAGLAGISTTGASSFWNVSTTLTIPIPGLSKPLIPDMMVTDDASLKQVLKTSSTISAVNLLTSTLVKQGVPQAEARKQAQELFAREVVPPVNYIADNANVFSLKPLVLFDVAQLNGPGGSRHFESTGGGIEFMIVNFAFQTGYARTLNPRAGDRKGNVILSLQFRNIF